MRRIPLTQGTFALVDDKDFDYLNQWKWCVYNKNNFLYVIRGIKKGNKTISVRMHRVITGAPKGMEVDHRNHNGLDNSRCNLRICTRSQNQHNQKLRAKSKTSKYKGVCWNKSDNRWYALIGLHGKQFFLGSFKNEIEAARAYDAKAMELHGEFAYINFREETRIVESAKRVQLRN